MQKKNWGNFERKKNAPKNKKKDSENQEMGKKKNAKKCTFLEIMKKAQNREKNGKVFPALPVPRPPDRTLGGSPQTTYPRTIPYLGIICLGMTPKMSQSIEKYSVTLLNIRIEQLHGPTHCRQRRGNSLPLHRANHLLHKELLDCRCLFSLESAQRAIPFHRTEHEKIKEG